jgi:hypothetical protein
MHVARGVVEFTNENGETFRSRPSGENPHSVVVQYNVATANGVLAGIANYQSPEFAMEKPLTPREVEFVDEVVANVYLIYERVRQGVELPDVYGTIIEHLATNPLRGRLDQPPPGG